MGDQSKSYKGAGDIQESNDASVDLIRQPEVPKKGDPQTDPDKRPLAGLGRRIEVA